MNSVVAALVAVATVSASPFLFDSTLVSSGSPKLAVFHHSSVSSGSGASSRKLRFVHLVPKVSYLGEFSEGVASEKLGHSPKVHNFLSFSDTERLSELVGLSDCHQWYSVLLTVWHVHSSSLVHKAYTWLHGQEVKVVGDVDSLVDHVHTHLLSLEGSVKLFSDLVKKGLTSHVFTLKLHSKMEHSLKLHH